MHHAKANRQQHKWIHKQQQESSSRSRPDWNRNNQRERDQRQKDSRLIVELRDPVLQFDVEQFEFGACGSSIGKVGVQVVGTRHAVVRC
jgi:hypothetical protein